MDQESFESLIRSKFEKEGVKAPSGVWNTLVNTLNSQTIIALQSSQDKFKWLAVAAVFIAVISFAINTELNSVETPVESQSFNALLPSSSEHFRFYEPIIQEPVSGTQWSTILFVEKNTRTKTEPSIQLTEKGDGLLAQEFELARISPEADRVIVKGDFEAYYVPQVRSVRRNSNDKSKFWAEVEAGVGSFNPDFNGTDPISGSVDFDALASSIGQNSFVNPTSTAVQDGMNQGVTTSLGLDFGMKMGRKWTLESGVQYTNVQNQSSASLNVVDIYTINSTEVFTSDGDLSVPIVAPSARQTEVEESFDHNINLDNNLKFTSIPLKAGYYLMDSKLSLRLNAGIAANYFLSNRLIDPSGQLQASTENIRYNEWSFDGLTGFEFGFSVSDNLNMTIEPNYRRSITPLSQSLVNRSGFMVQTGFRYTIK